MRTHTIDLKSRWSRADLDYLCAHAKQQTPEQLAEKLGRPVSSITAKLAKITPDANDDGYTVRDLADAFGCAEQQVAQWLALRWIVPKKQVGIGPIRFSDNGVRRFVRAHPLAIDHTQIDDSCWLWIVDLLAGREKGLGALSNPNNAPGDEEQQPA